MVSISFTDYVEEEKKKRKQNIIIIIIIIIDYAHSPAPTSDNCRRLIHLSMAVQPLWTLAAFQYPNLYTADRSPVSLDGGSARRKAANYT
jgi:hypothetical protein